jgi:hypothetical protein
LPEGDEQTKESTLFYCRNARTRTEESSVLVGFVT